MSNRFSSFSSASRTYITSAPIHPSFDVAYEMHDHIRAIIFPSLCEVLEIDSEETWEAFAFRLFKGASSHDGDYPKSWLGAGNVVEVLEDFLHQYRRIYSTDVGEREAQPNVCFSCFNNRSGGSLVWVHRLNQVPGGCDFTFSSRL